MTDKETSDVIERVFQNHRDFSKLLIILSTALLTFTATDANYVNNAYVTVKIGLLFQLLSLWAGIFFLSLLIYEPLIKRDKSTKYSSSNLFEWLHHAQFITFALSFFALFFNVMNT